ncbi:MAG: DNA adenine methylase [Candidatus Binataceae bacterium]
MAAIGEARFNLSPGSSPGASPFIKWAGGKTQLLPQLARLLPSSFRAYAEPFLGSGALFFYLRRTLGKFPAYLSDYNEELVNCYIVVRDSLQDLLPLLKDHTARHGREHYYRVRDQKPADLDMLHRAARLIYLNKTCFNGLYRVNSDGRFNVPIGSYLRPRIYDAAALQDASDALQDTHIFRADFAEVEHCVSSGDFVYFDPPYHPVSKTSSFTGYAVSASMRHGRTGAAAAGFRFLEQQRTAATFCKISKSGCAVMLSNSDSERIRTFYREFTIETVAARRIINCDGSKRGSVREIVAMNYSPPR